MKRNEKAFTLIELMIVVAILGILAAFAISQFSSYKERAYDAAAKSALRNVAVAMENYYQDNGLFAATESELEPWFKPEENVRVKILTSEIDSWSAASQHIYSENVWYYDSSAGGLQDGAYGAVVPGWN